MKTKHFILLVAFLLSGIMMKAQSTCTDLNGYVDSKNTGPTGYFDLVLGQEEEVAQTYQFSGSAKIGKVRIYGNFPFLGGVPLAVSIYDVDANGRPTSALQTTNTVWWWNINNQGYIDVTLSGGGVYVDSDFAVAVRVRSAFPYGNVFRVGYTGDGEGNGEDLASVSGTTTGFNWTSAATNFNKDGDFYLVPEMTHFFSAGFNIASQCYDANSAISFSNTSQVTTDKMFNTLFMPGYMGNETLYTWNFGDGSPESSAANPTHTFTAPGSYTVSLTTTIVGWDGICTDVYSKTISVGISVSATAITNVSCNGGADGSVTGVGAGGATPYSYSLSGDSYQSSGVFNGLTAGNYTLYVKDNLGCVKSTAFSITQPSAISFTSASSTNASCGDSNGSILVNATGGVGALQYQLDSGTFQSTGAFSNLSPGGYVVTVKDANSCTASIVVTVKSSAGPVLNVLSTTNVSCYGGNDGSIVMLGNGGTGTLQYSIDNGANFQTSGSFPNVSAGTYFLVVKDAAGCSDVEKLSITQPAPLVVTAVAVDATCNGSNNGRITISSATGGIGALSYSINGTNYQSGTTFQGVAPGTYTVYVRDVASCMATTSVTVNQPSPLSITTTVTDAVCNGSYDGIITASGSGGNGGYSYSLNGTIFQTSGTFTGLSAGNYNVYMRDSKNCLSVKTVAVGEPSLISASITTTASTCGNPNGGFLVTASGGSGSGYEYSLDGINFNTSGLFTNLDAGTYYILVADGAGCYRIFSATIIDSDGPTITGSTHTNVSCNGGFDGSITITSVTGGTGTIEYSINGTDWQTSNSFTELSAGDYTVIIRDANGCSGNVSVTVTEPSAFAITTTVTNVLCNGSNTGSILVLAAGGSGTLAYSINYGQTYQSSNVFGNLTAGTYNVIVRDGGGCTGTKSATIYEPTAINIATEVLNVSCKDEEDGAISVVAWGGTGSYTYSLDGNTYQQANYFENLDGGNYTVYVKDANNCVETLSVIVVEPAAINVLSSQSNVSCAGGNNGVIDLSVTGGRAPFYYVWSNGATTEDVFNLNEGDYDVYISDANGCFYTNTFTITEPATPLIINGVVTDATNSTSEDGVVDVTVTGGTPSYSYLWSTGEFGQDISGVNPGTYTVTVTDNNNCETANSFTVGSLNSVADMEAVVKNISLYPNPASNYTLVVTKDNIVMEQLRVVNLIGEVVFESKEAGNSVKINTLDFAEGIYFIRLMADNQFVTKRFEVIH